MFASFISISLSTSSNLSHFTSLSLLYFGFSMLLLIDKLNERRPYSPFICNPSLIKQHRKLIQFFSILSQWNFLFIQQTVGIFFILIYPLLTAPSQNTHYFRYIFRMKIKTPNIFSIFSVCCWRASRDKWEWKKNILRRGKNVKNPCCFPFALFYILSNIYRDLMWKISHPQKKTDPKCKNTEWKWMEWERKSEYMWN